MKQQHKQTPAAIRQRKFLLALPLLALPFLTMLFWALGGGSVPEADAQAQSTKGLNSQLPDAGLKDDRAMDKMSYYDQAALDSLKFSELVKSDPNYQDDLLFDTGEMDMDSFVEQDDSDGLNPSLYQRGSAHEPKSDAIYRRLAELDRQINRPGGSSSGVSGDEYVEDYSDRTETGTSVSSADIDRLEQMMHTMSGASAPDPELQQLDGMLEKILDVQHPDRVQEKLKQSSEQRKGQVFAVAATSDDRIPVSVLDAPADGQTTSNGFYSPQRALQADDIPNAIQAVIHETQTLVNGSTVKLRLLHDVFVSGVRVPKNSFLFGIASLNNERLNIKIPGIRYHESLLPVELSVFDMDGLDGIYIPGAISRDVAKQSADRTVQSIGLTTLDPSWQAQAASAGIEAAKTLFSRKVKLIKVTVKAGYRVLLRDEKQNNIH